MYSLRFCTSSSNYSFSFSASPSSPWQFSLSCQICWSASQSCSCRAWLASSQWRSSCTFCPTRVRAPSRIDSTSWRRRAFSPLRVVMSCLSLFSSRASSTGASAEMLKRSLKLFTMFWPIWSNSIRLSLIWCKQYSLQAAVMAGQIINIPYLYLMSLPPALLLLRDRLHQHPFEVAMVMLVLVNVLQYLLGCKENQKRLVRWLSPLRPFLLSQFAHLGTSPTHNTAFFSEESKNEFVFFASGRANCSFLQVRHRLIKRQDLLSRLSVQLLCPAKDQVIYDLPVESTQPIVFSLVRKSLHKSVYHNNADLTNLGNKFSREGLSEQYVVFAENQETVDYVLEPSLLALLQESSSIEQIFITDQKSIMDSPLTLRLVHDSLEQDQEQLLAINKALLQLVDRLAAFRLSGSNRSVAVKEREIIFEIENQDKQQRLQEELNQKKLEKKQREDELLRKSNPEKLKRQDEREKKAALQKRYKSKFVKM